MLTEEQNITFKGSNPRMVIEEADGKETKCTPVQNLYYLKNI